jgi:3-hydroxyisobutyrate dehydrogenase
MGSAMAHRLVDADFTVRGYDVSQEAKNNAEKFGVTTFTSIEETTHGSDCIILMLPDSNVVESVLTNPVVEKTFNSKLTVLDMSSSEPQRTRVMASHLETFGVSMLDAPVSGGVKGAESGKLTIMVGGEEKILASQLDVLNTFGRVVHAGPIGSGHAVKALNNLMSATHLWVTSEVMLTGEKFGLDPQIMLDIFNGSSGRSGSTENKWPNFILGEQYDSGFGLRLMLKDMKIAVQLAAQEGVPHFLGQEAVALWALAAEDLDSKSDHTEVARWLRQESAKDGV